MAAFSFSASSSPCHYAPLPHKFSTSTMPTRFWPVNKPLSPGLRKFCISSGILDRTRLRHDKVSPIEQLNHGQPEPASSKRWGWVWSQPKLEEKPLGNQETLQSGNSKPKVASSTEEKPEELVLQWLKAVFSAEKPQQLDGQKEKEDEFFFLGSGASVSLGNKSDDWKLNFNFNLHTSRIIGFSMLFMGWALAGLGNVEALGKVANYMWAVAKILGGFLATQCVLAGVAMILMKIMSKKEKVNSQSF